MNIIEQDELIKKIEELRLEDFEKIQTLELKMLNKFTVTIPLNVGEIEKRVGQEMVNERKNSETYKRYTDEMKEWLLAGFPGENEELIILDMLKNISILKLKEMEYKIKSEYYIRRPFTDTQIREFQVLTNKISENIFGYNPNNNMVDIVYETMKNHEKKCMEESKRIVN